jgi:hypothetical protein
MELNTGAAGFIRGIPSVPPALKEFMFNFKILPKTPAFLFVFAPLTRILHEDLGLSLFHRGKLS